LKPSIFNVVPDDDKLYYLGDLVMLLRSVALVHKSGEETFTITRRILIKIAK
jgi:hypothetical protein